MKKIILFIVISALFPIDRPSIALVLSGGGLKGISQIPTLQVLDSLNIPIDYVIGTSIGSIGGALYSIGYSPQEIKETMLRTDWDLIMFDKKVREKLSYFQKKDYHKYQLEFRLKNLKPTAPIAFNNGQESFLFLNKLTRYNETIDDFDDFVIPFRCNATDLLTGEEIIFNNGSLSKALRCSSSIPSIFNPVYDNDKLLVDGGVLNNLATDIAKKLGADIIISMLGDARGNAPGGYLHLSEDFEIVGRWENSMGDIKFSYDFWYQPRHNIMVSSEWAAPNNFMPEFDLEEVRSSKIWT